MSIVEVLIAAGLLLMIAIGILPLLTRAVANNVRGWEATIFANETKGSLEEGISDPVNAADLLVAPGSTEITQTESWAMGDPDKEGDVREGWHPGTPTDKGTLLYERTRRVRQYHLSELLDNPVSVTSDVVRYRITMSALDAPLGGGESPAFKHLTGIELFIEGLREGGGLGAGQKMRTSYLKAI